MWEYEYEYLLLLKHDHPADDQLPTFLKSPLHEHLQEKNKDKSMLEEGSGPGQMVKISKDPENNPMEIENDFTIKKK